MVVSIRALDCLDLSLWLSSTDQAAAYLGLSRQTVEETIQAVSTILEIAVAMNAGPLLISGDPTLLHLLRRNHQHFRWESGHELRLEVLRQPGVPIRNPIPHGWLIKVVARPNKEACLQHLRTGVIDAWITDAPTTPEPDDPDLVGFDWMACAGRNALRSRQGWGQAEANPPGPTPFGRIGASQGPAPDKDRNHTPSPAPCQHPASSKPVPLDQAEVHHPDGIPTTRATPSNETPPQRQPVQPPGPQPGRQSHSLVVKRAFMNHPRFDCLCQTLQRNELGMPETILR